MRELIPARIDAGETKQRASLRGEGPFNPPLPLRYEDYVLAPSLGMNFSATPLLQYRKPVGGGPSSKRWPW